MNVYERKQEYKEIRHRFLLHHKDILNKLYTEFKDDYIDTRTVGIIKLIGKMPRINILILTVNDIETYCLHKKLMPIDGETHIISMSIAEKVFFIGRLGDYNVLHMVTEMGSDTLQGTYESLKWLKEQYKLKLLVKIKLIISVGVCYGIDWKKTPLCDVIVPHSVITFDKNIKYSGNIIKQRHVRAFGTECALNDITQAIVDQNNLKHNFTFSLHKKTLITGEVLVDSSNFKKRVLDSLKEYPSTGKYHFNDIYGGDMEAFGMYKAVAKELPNGKVDKNSKIFSNCSCLTIKGICDFGEFKNLNSDLTIENSISDDAVVVKDKLQLMAAKNACDVSEQLLRCTPIHKKMKLIENYEILKRRAKMRQSSLYFLGLSLLCNLACFLFLDQLLSKYQPSFFYAINIIIVSAILCIVKININFEKKKKTIKNSQALQIEFTRDNTLGNYFYVRNMTPSIEISNIAIKSLKICSKSMLVNYDLNKNLGWEIENELRKESHCLVVIKNLIFDIIDEDEKHKLDFLNFEMYDIKIEVVFCYLDSYKNAYEQKYIYDASKSQNTNETSVKK